jgi:hypothetical protein
LGFPAKFNTLALIITRGQGIVGQIFGGGAITFTVAAPGTYVLNALAQVGSGLSYGLYGLRLAPAPTATLTAGASSISAGQSTTLTWGSSNATSCTAAGGPASSVWNGVLAPSGSQSISGLTETTTFVISCSGNGASANASIQVMVNPAAARSGGGGAIAINTLLMLGLGAAWAICGRRMTV